MGMVPVASRCTNLFLRTIPRGDTVPGGQKFEGRVPLKSFWFAGFRETLFDAGPLGRTSEMTAS